MVRETSTLPPATDASTVAPNQVHETLKRHLLVDGFPIVFDLEQSQGSWIVDAATGKRYLDFFTFFASLPVGFNHPELARPEWKERLLRAAIHKPSSSDAYTTDMASFVRTFCEVAMPPGFPHLFFVEGGTLAVENALKVAFDWKTRKNRARGVAVPGHRVLHFREAFHGRSGYTLSLTNTDPVKTDLYPKFDWPRVENPKLCFPVDAAETARVADVEGRVLADIEALFRAQPNEIAAVIIEPIQCEGGDNHFRPEFLRALRRMADEYDALLILDEVQSGFGLTGRFWAHEHAGITPDIIAFGKKSQVCGILAGPRVDEIPDNVFRIPSRINSTWGGNLVDMVRCEAYLKIIRRDRLVENASEVGAHLLAGLDALAARSAGRIANVRGRGLLCAFDLPTSEARSALQKRGLEEGLILLACGQRSIRLRPPLTLTAPEAAEGVERIARALAR